MRVCGTDYSKERAKIESALSDCQIEKAYKKHQFMNLFCDEVVVKREANLRLANSIFNGICELCFLLQKQVLHQKNLALAGGIFARNSQI